MPSDPSLGLWPATSSFPTPWSYLSESLDFYSEFEQEEKAEELKEGAAVKKPEKRWGLVNKD